MGLLQDLAKLFAQEQNEYGTPSTTRRGELVKSKAEKLIADYFADNGIRYLYEWRAQTDALIGIGKWLQNAAVAVAETIIFTPLAIVVDGSEVLWTQHVQTQLAKQITQIVG